MNLDELQSVQSRERQTDQLQQLRATFYEEAGQFVAQLREERKRAADRVDDPFDAPEVNRLTNDIKTAEQTVEAVYERRVGKIVKMASLAAADMPTDDGGLTQEERQLFETMVEAIEGNREHVLDVVAGEAPTGAVGDGEADTGGPAPTDTGPDLSAEDSTPQPATESPSPTESDPAVDAADIMGGGSGAADTESAPQSPPTEPDQSAGSPGGDALGSGADTASAAEPADASAGDSGTERPPEEALSAASGGDDVEVADEVERRTVRITDEVGEIFGVDQREYDLSTNDVVTLPADNADPLVERDAAEPLE